MNKEILSKKEQLFMYLVGTFQSSAWIALGKIKNPMTEKSKVNIEQASFYIDLLDMMQEKMKGNLTDYEEQMLINTVSELKLNLIDEKNISKDKKEPKKIKKKKRSFKKKICKTCFGISFNLPILPQTKNPTNVGLDVV